MSNENMDDKVYRAEGSNYDVVEQVLAPERLDVAQLRASFKGQVIGPEDAGYEEARTVFYGGVDRRPAVIIRPVDTNEVSRVVLLARETGLPLAVRSGGHSSAGHSVVEGGIVLDLKDMKGLQIDAKNRTAWVETGLTAVEYTTAADAHDLATGFGDTGTVGIGGLTLGGGIGFLVRKHGMTIDSLLAAEVVTADGELLYVDEQNHPDLFWAIRGGGGNFGVATRFKFRLQELGDIYGGMLFLPATPEVIAAFIAEAESAPEELSTIANVMPAPPMPFIPEELHGQMIVFAMLVYAGPVEAGEQALAPFRAIATPLADMLKPMRYPEMFPPEEGDYHPTAVGTTIFLDEIGRSEAEKIVSYLAKSDAVLRVAQLRVLGGAMSRVPDEATAFAHRNRRIMAGIYAFYDGPEDRVEKEAWAAELSRELQPGHPGGYVNFLGDEGEGRIRQAYPGATWDRLRQIKARYDPTNLFKMNQNIPPAGL